MKQKPRKVLYERFKAENAEKKEMEKLQEHFGEEVVVKKISTAAEVMRILVELLSKIMRFLWWLLVVALCSIGVTVLINASTRQALFALFGI